jgi:hypothetical protein
MLWLDKNTPNKSKAVEEALIEKFDLIKKGVVNE